MFTWPASVLASKSACRLFTNTIHTSTLKMSEHRDVSESSGDNVSLGRPGEKRTTSSARQPMTGLPLPQRVQRRRDARNSSAGVEPARTNVWRAQLAKVSSCEGLNYDGGKGLVTVFEFNEARPSSRCFLKCDGNSQKLVITLSTFVQHQDPSPSGLFEIVLPSEDDLLDLRIYESTRCLELRLTPKGEASSKQEPRKIWSLFFRTDIKHLNNAKKMVKRLENVTSEMPEYWFSYRNYSRSPNLEPPTEGSEFVPSVFSQPIVGGHVWNFTGFFASLEFQRALGNVTADAAEKKSDPLSTRATKTRSQTKAEKKTKKHAKRRQARQKAAGQLPDDDSLAGDIDTSPEPEMSGTQSKKQTAATAGSSRSTPSVTSQEYEIEKILDIRVDHESKNTQFQVQWVGFEQLTWEPATLIPPSSIEDFYRGRLVVSQPQSGRGRGSRRGRGGRGGRGNRADDS